MPVVNLKSRKKILLLTMAPKGTFGDLKFGANLVKQAGDKLDIALVVETDQEIPSGLFSSSVSITRLTKCDVSEIPSSILENVDAFVIGPYLPADTWFSGDITRPDPRIVKFLKQLPQDKTLITITDYNLEESRRALHKNYQSAYPRVECLETGFGKLGVQCQPPPTDLNEIYEMASFSEPALFATLFQGKSKEDYLSSTHLYFAYLNTEYADFTYKNNKVDLITTIEIFLTDALMANQKQQTSDKPIDIVIPWSKNISAVDIFSRIEKIPNWRSIFRKVKFFEESGKNTNNKFSPTLTFLGEGSCIVRIIDKFPLAYPAMQYLLNQSRSPNVLTGSQSTMEGYLNGKSVMLQIMEWQYDFFLAQLQEIKMFCIKELDDRNAILYQFYSLQHQLDLPTDRYFKQILDFQHENKGILEIQQHKFSEYLLKQCNLNNTLVPAILEVLGVKKNLKKLSEAIYKDRISFHKLAFWDKATPNPNLVWNDRLPCLTNTKPYRWFNM